MGEPMEPPTCQTCMLFDEFEDGTRGYCRAHAPRERREWSEDHSWPIVLHDDWCGEHTDFARWLRECEELEDRAPAD